MIPAQQKAEIERDFVSRTPRHPVKLAEYLSSELPDPGRWRWCLIAVTDADCAAISNGVAWKRADGSTL